MILNLIDGFLCVYNSVEEIDFNSPPNQFVLKTTHGGGGGGVVVCKDKSTLNIAECKRKLQRSMKQNIYWHLREWPYKDVRPRIIAEKLLEVKECEDLPDYKFFCFNGAPKCCQVIAGRNDVMTVDFFDKEWNHLPFHEPKVYPFSQEKVSKPQSFDIMWSLAEKLSANQPFLRVDFYDIQGHVYFGELTFFHFAGFVPFEPEEWDYKLGEFIELHRI